MTAKMGKICTFTLLFILLLGFFHSKTIQATFYGDIPQGYQFVKKSGSGYGVYVPKSFNPSTRSTLVFAFGRSRNDMALTKEQLRNYAERWFAEAEKRSFVLVVPYWEPVVIGAGQSTENFFLEIIEEARMMYNIHPQKVLVAGFGLGAVEAFSLAAFHPERFQAVVTIGSSPLGDRTINNLMQARLTGKQIFRKLPPVLLVQGENDTILTLQHLEEDKSILESQGARVEIKQIPDMGQEHDPKANAFILDWFDSLQSGEQP